MRIGAGVLHYRFWPEVRPTLDGLLAQTRRPDHLLVYEHASGDDSAEQIRAAYPDVEVVEAPENRGPAAGEKALMRTLLERDFDAILIMPHDLELAPDALERLEARLEEDEALGAVGPITADIETRDRIWYAGGYVKTHRTGHWELSFREEPRELSAWRGRPPHAVDFLQTGGMLLRAAAAREVGDTEERFYYWMDDVDFTLRLSASGWRIECVPAAVGWQEFGDPSPYIATRNRLLVVARNAPRHLLAREIVRQLYLIGHDAIKPPNGSREDLWPRLRGWVDFCRGRWGPPPASLTS
jgi:GT2 family glycosyltransferase